MNSRILLCLFTPILLISCFEEDQRVAPYAGKISVIDKDIEVFQTYYDLEEDTVIKTDSAKIWQLGFECGTNGWHIITNSGDNWFLYNTRQTDIETDASIPPNVYGLYDVQSACPDSTAAGNWLISPANGQSSGKEIYLLGKQSGLTYSEIKKIVFLEMDSSGYKFYYRDEKSGIDDTVNIQKTDTANFVYYSFHKRKQLNSEPNKFSYDLVFGPYYDLATLFNQTIPYLVRGTLLNTWQTTVAIDSTDSYSSITYETLSGYDLKPQRDGIGYRWKDVTVEQSSGNSVYNVRMNYVYLIHTAQGNYYKLRFVDYMLGSESGYPQFEFELLGR